MVVGHYGCGGVRCALSNRRVGLADNWLRHVQDVHKKHGERFGRCTSEDEAADRLCELNVVEQVLNVSQTTILQDAWERGRDITVHAWIYRLQTGKLYDLGATISAASPFILCFGSSLSWQVAMIAVLTVGEALWSPRLYEYNVAIAPAGQEATYVGLAKLPFFLAKLVVTPMSGWLLASYCPDQGARDPAMLWAIVGLTTVAGPLGMWLLQGWIQEKRSETE